MTKDLWQGTVGPTKYLCPWCSSEDPGGSIFESEEAYLQHAKTHHPGAFRMGYNGTLEVVAIDLDKGIVTVRSKP